MQLARETIRLCVFLLAFGGGGGVGACVRVEMEIPTCWNFQRVSYTSIRRVPAYMPVTFTGGVKTLVLEGVAGAEYDSNCCFFGHARNASVPRQSAPVVNTAKAVQGSVGGGGRGGGVAGERNWRVIEQVSSH